MSFKITFSKTAVDDFFNGAKCAKFRIEKGRGMLLPVSRSGDGAIDLLSRNRGGSEISFAGPSFKKEQTVLDNGDMPFFTLSMREDGWIEMVPFKSAGAPEKFKPVARFWDLDRKSNYIPVAERDEGDVPVIRRPVGRPRKIPVETQEAAPIKRGAGRPKKVVSPARVESIPHIAHSDLLVALREARRIVEQSRGPGRPSKETTAARELLEAISTINTESVGRIAPRMEAEIDKTNHPIAIMMIYPTAVPMVGDMQPVIEAISKTLGVNFSGKTLDIVPAIAAQKVEAQWVGEAADKETPLPELIYVPETDLDLTTIEENAARAAALWKEQRRTGSSAESSGNVSHPSAFPKRSNTRTIVVEDRRRTRQMA